MFQIEINLDKIKETIKFHAEKSGRNFEDIEIVAVTKGRSLSEIERVLTCGINKIGENRVQEARSKLASLKIDFESHLIGHLQTNKARDAVEIFELIQSVDSLKLAQTIAEKARIINKIQKVLIQVNTSGEATKFGVAPAELPFLIEGISRLKNISVTGLMTMAPFSDDPEAARKFFKKLFDIFIDLKRANISNVEMNWLSMGMSQDYQVAVEEGANLLRIGSAIFAGPGNN